MLNDVENTLWEITLGWEQTRALGAEREREEARSVRGREGNNLNVLKDFWLRNGSSESQNLAATVLYVPS